MRSLKRFILDAPYRMLATSAVALAATTEMAQAQVSGGIGSVATNLTGQFSAMGSALLGASFLGGVGLVGAGLLKLKAAADSGGQQVKYGEGIWRLAVGSGLVALPTMATVGTNTFFTSGSATATQGTMTFGR